MMLTYCIRTPFLKSRILQLSLRWALLHSYRSKTNSPPALNSSRKAKVISDIYSSFGFTQGQITRILQSPQCILSFGQDDLVSNLAVWHNYDLNKKLLISLTSYPELLTLSPEYVDSRFKELMSLFTKTDINKLLITCPKVFLDEFDSVKEKVEYIINFMGVEQKSIVKTEALQFDLTHIKCRHLFLKRAGFYRVKKAVVQPKTPPLNKVFSRNMKTFLKLSGLTNEEYVTFLTAYEFEELEKDYDDSDEEI